MDIRIDSEFFPRVAVEADTVTSSDAISRLEMWRVSPSRVLRGKV